MNSDQQFLANLARVLAHTIVLEHQLPYEARLCGDTSSPGQMEDTAAMMQAMTKYYPELSRVVSEGALPVGQNLQNAQNVLAPQAAALQAQLYRDYGPGINATGAEIAAQNAQRQAESDLALLSGTGRGVVSAQRAAQELADPEYFKAREQTVNALSNLFGSLDDPNGTLSGAERAEIDRSLARSNAQRGVEVPTATTTVENAMDFGQAGAARKQQKQAAIAAAVGTGTNFLPAAKSNVDVGATVLGRPTQANTGEARLGDPSTTGQSESMALGSQMWNQLGQLRQSENEINSKRRDALDRSMQVTAGVADIADSGCCFIFMEAINGPLPWFVREYRDAFGTLRMQAGYKRMARWLVPLMRKSHVIKWIVNTVMVRPLIKYAGWWFEVPGYKWSRINARIKNFWLRVWSTI